jgi:TonB family protein
VIATLMVLSTLVAADTTLRIPGTSVRFGTTLERLSTIGRFEPPQGTPGPGGISRPPPAQPQGTEVREGPLRFFGLDAIASLGFQDHALSVARFVVDPISPHSFDYLEDQLRRLAYRRSCVDRGPNQSDCEWLGPATVHVSLTGRRMTATVRPTEPPAEPIAAAAPASAATGTGTPSDTLAAVEEPVTLTLAESDSLPPPIAIETCKPQRPEAARRDGVFGRVVVRVLVDVDGRVADAQIERGITSLNAAALDCARRFRFAPYVVNGRPTRVWHPIALAFLLD